MKNSKLLEILSTFDAEEMARLSAFLRSPYFHQPEIAVDEWRLFELLHQAFPDFVEEQVAKQGVLEHLYPGSAFVKGKLEKRMSALLRKIERFIDMEERFTGPQKVASLLHIARYYRKKKLTRLYDINLAQLQKAQAQLTPKEPNDFLHEFLLQKEISEYQSVFTPRKKDLNLANLSKSLDEFYLLEKLIHTCALLSQRQFHNQIELHDSLLFLEKIVPLKSLEAYAEIPLIRVFLQVYFILQKMREQGADDFAAYQELEILLIQYDKQLPLQALKAFHVFSRSFYTRQFNKGKLDLKDKLFQLYQTHLDKGYLFSDGGLTPGVFKNVVWIGLTVKKYDWVFSFLQAYQHRIVGTAYPQDIYQLNLANYHFRLREYEQALDCLQDTYEDFYYQLAAKRLKIKIYFEEHSELLDSQLNSFRLYLRRLSKNKLPESTRAANNNFVNILKQILLPKTFKNPKRIKNLQEKIKGIAVIKEQEWLLEKLDGL